MYSSPSLVLLTFIWFFCLRCLWIWSQPYCRLPTCSVHPARRSTTQRYMRCSSCCEDKSVVYRHFIHVYCCRHPFTTPERRTAVSMLTYSAPRNAANRYIVQRLTSKMKNRQCPIAVQRPLDSFKALDSLLYGVVCADSTCWIVCFIHTNNDNILYTI